MLSYFQRNVLRQYAWGSEAAALLATYAHATKNARALLKLQRWVKRYNVALTPDLQVALYPVEPFKNLQPEAKYIP